MTTITIQDDLLHSIQKIAEREQQTVESVVNDWLARQFVLVREQKIKEEAMRFRKMHKKLRAKYLGKYIAMRDGEVLDSDEDVRILYLRIKERFGNEPILITPVQEQPLPTYHMRSPRVVR